MLENTAGGKPKVIVFIGGFRRSCVRSEEDLGLAREGNRFRLVHTLEIALREGLGCGKNASGMRKKRTTVNKPNNSPRLTCIFKGCPSLLCSVSKG